MKSPSSTLISRPPVIAVMGHVDHGKSTLLDTIRETNTVDKEFGGITQHLSAYEVKHKTKEGEEKPITFLDTPGHSAFSSMRIRGATVADIGILVVAADDGVKPQTLEALKALRDNNTPFVVAINKIDKPGADPEKTKLSLSEHEVYLEGYGGQIPFALISAKKGDGIEDLLDTILLLAEMEDWTGDTSIPAEGVVLEAHRDPKKGVSATVLIKNGAIKKGDFIVAGHALSTTRLFTNTFGQNIEEARFSSPIVVTGWSDIPPVGATFQVFSNKKDAELACVEETKHHCMLISSLAEVSDHETHLVPLIIKTDVGGTFDAIEKELCKLQTKDIAFKLIHHGVGDISESDMTFAQADGEVVIIGFNVKADKSALDIAEQYKATIQTFNIIYKMTEWAEELLKTRKPKKTKEEIVGQARILKIFNKDKKAVTIGAEVVSGFLKIKSKVRIKHADEIKGNGAITELQQSRKDIDSIKEGQFGARIETDSDIKENDLIEVVSLVTS